MNGVIRSLRTTEYTRGDPPTFEDLVISDTDSQNVDIGVKTHVLSVSHP